MWSKRLAAVALGMSVALGACMAPPSQSQRLTEAARELNLSSRFGRMDIAVTHAAKPVRSIFLERRASWGHELRVLDVELAGLSMKDEHHAVVKVDVQWMRMDESSLRVTRLAQVWTDDSGSWEMTREKRVAGDMGLFGEQVEVLHPEHRDAHFPVTTIR